MTQQQKTTNKISRIKALWANWLQQYKHKSVALYGGGEHTQWLANLLQNDFYRMPIDCIIDSAPSQQEMLGFRLVKSDLCNLDEYDFIIISSQFSEQEIYQFLESQIDKTKIGRMYDRSRQQVFFDFYEENHWKSAESISGRGSELTQTLTLIEQLPKLFEKLKISRLLDVPCGDFNWMKNLLSDEMVYIGGDIIENIVLENIDKYQSDNINFEWMDLLTSALPAADAILCRDCLVHFSYADIEMAINNIKGSEVLYFITTCFIERDTNRDISTGNWRPLNLLAEPFNFPTPIEVLLEGCTESDGKYKDKALCVWNVADLPGLA